MKLFFSLLVSLSLFSTSLMASSIQRSGIKEAMDELNFALNVEWDQKDPNFYTDQMSLFHGRVEKLSIRKIDQEKVFLAALEAAPESPFKNDLKNTFKQTDVNKMPSAEFRKLLIDLSKRSSTEGASWIGDIPKGVQAVLLIGLLILIEVVNNSKAEPTYQNSNPVDPSQGSEYPNYVYTFAYGNTSTGSYEYCYGYSVNGGTHFCL